jgi:ABC-type methionine transport system ATPase subunit
MIAEKRVRLVYPKSLLNQPLIFRLIKDFNLLTNIVNAQVTDENGWLELMVKGEAENVDQGLAWMAGQGVHVEILSEKKEFK